MLLVPAHPVTALCLGLPGSPRSSQTKGCKMIVVVVVTVTYQSKTYAGNLHVSYPVCLECFDTVGWAAGRASGL